MNIRDRRAVRAAAQQALAAAPGEPKKVVLAYTLISCAIALSFAGISMMLGDRISATGGLSNMGMRSILSTGQSVLPLVQMVISICMSLGYHVAILDMLRHRATDPRTLSEGFRRFGPALRAALLQGVIYFFLAFGTMYLSSFVFMLLPLSNAFFSVMEPLTSSMSILESGIVLDDATVSALIPAMAPLVWIFLGLYLLLFLPMAYRFRMISFSLADDDRPGAIAAMVKSARMMRHNRFALFRLDLSMWWFYALQILVSVVCYGDVICALAGVALPWNETVSYFLFFGLSLVIQAVSYYFFMNRVYAVYGVTYEGLKESIVPPPRPKEKPDFPFPTEY